jgi:amicyanin
MAGFEFTIPFTLSRYFGHRGAPKAPSGADTVQHAAAAGATGVRIANLAFDAKTVRVRVGTTVRWTNGDQLQHSVTADDGTFNSGLIDPNRSYEHVFDRPGDYAYHCTPHPFMTGHVIVEP